MVFNALSHDNKWNISAVFSQQTVVLKANDFYALLHTWNFYIQMYVHLNAFVIMVDIFLFEERSRSINMFYASSRD